VGNYLYYYPWLNEISYPIDEMGVEVTTAGAGLIRLGIYNADVNWVPTTLVLDAGTVDCSTTGVKRLAMSLTLPVGRFYGCLIANVSPTLRMYKSLGSGPSSSVNTNLGTSPATAVFNVSRTYGVLPASGPAIAGISYGPDSFPTAILVHKKTAS
jgi:hypothetical protein